ncbi:uncharacterized [Tachysurus ichikawai]
MGREAVGGVLERIMKLSFLAGFNATCSAGTRKAAIKLVGKVHFTCEEPPDSRSLLCPSASLNLGYER